MKSILLALFFLFVYQFSTGQNLETFEDEAITSQTFTSAGQVFNIIEVPGVAGNYRVRKFMDGEGWNGTAPDNLYVDNNGSTDGAAPLPLKIRTAGATVFNLKSLYLFLAKQDLNFNIGPSTVTITGRLSGSEVFSVTVNSGFTTSYATNNGYTFFNLSTINGIDNSTKNIDEFEITFTGGIGYVAMDAMTWALPSSCPSVTVTQSSKTDVSCFGGGNGAASVTASGGSGFTYNWTPGNPTGDGSASITGLPANTYTCTVTNSCGNTGSVQITITQPAAALTATGSSTPVSCNGGGNGTITAIPSGGTTPYHYAWSPSGGSNQTATGRIAGTYTCSITDNKGCTTSYEGTVTQPAAFSAIISSTDVSCNGGSNGTATLSNISGGTTPYSFSWSPSGGIGPTATGLSAREYTCTIEDNNGCIYSRKIEVHQPALLTATQSQTDLVCNNSGSASVIVSGGVTPYTYSWSPSGGTGSTASILTAGNYEVKITDNNGCFITKEFTIGSPQSTLSATIDGVHVTCAGFNNGKVTVSNVTGGQAPYTYSWSSGGNGNSISNLAPGTYTCMITDNLGCSITRSFTITEPEVLSATVSQTDVICTTLGTASINVSGGITPYTYTWTPAISSSNTATGLTAGNYSVQVKDKNGCSLTSNYIIASSSSTITYTPDQSNVTCNGGNDGTASVNGITGGTTPYSYNWTPTGGSASTATNLSAGDYECTITDANGCSTTASFEITAPAAITANVITLPGNNTYSGGATLDFKVSFSTPVTVTGTPSLTLNLNTGGSVQATYHSQENPDKLVFRYTIAATDQDPDGIQLGANINLNGGSIRNTTGCDASLQLPTTPGTAGILIKNKVAQQISFNAIPAKTYGDADFSPGATSNSGLTISYSSSNTAVAVVDGNNLKIVGAGSTTITASQEGDADFLEAGNQTQLLTVNKRSVNVTANGASKVYGENDPAFTSTVTPSLVGTDQFSGTMERSSGSENAGTYTILQGTLALSNNYVINFQGADFVIHPKPVTVTADAMSKTFGQPDPSFTYSVSPSLMSGDAFTGSLSRTAGEDAGTYSINTASLSNNNYTYTLVPATFTINKATQQITWNQTLISGCDGINTITLTAVSSSGQPVTYSSGDLNKATINGNTLTVLAPGSATITATQAGNNNYLAAPTVSTELISKLPANILSKKWNDVLVFDNSSKEYTAWQWYKNGNLVNNATGQYYHENGNLSGTYHAVAKNTAGINVETCPVSITPGPAIKLLSVYPNPVAGGQAITVKASFTQNELQNATITLSDIRGVILQTIQNVTPTTTVNMPVAQGIYSIRLTLANGSNHSVNVLVK